MKILTAILILSLLWFYPFAEAGNVYSFDIEADNSTYLDAADNSAYSGTNDFSMAFWIKWESLPTANNEYDYIFVKLSGGGCTRSEINLRTEFRAASGLGFRSSVSFANDTDSTDQFTVPSGEALTTNRWYHVVWTWDSGPALEEFFIDGISRGTANSADTTGPCDSTGRFTIGHLTIDSTNPGDFLIDDFKIYWGRILVASEITDLMRKEATGNEAGLTAYWKMNDLLDSTSNANNLTNNNKALLSTDLPWRDRKNIIFDEDE